MRVGRAVLTVMSVVMNMTIGLVAVSETSPHGLAQI